jgi:hypothetical protein
VKHLIRSCIVLLCAAAASATTVVPMSVEELTRAASEVIEAHAKRSWSSWNAQHTLIYTYTTFEVTKRLKGATTESVTVKQVGGSADGYTQKVSGVRQFQEGEDALLFLRPSVARDGTLVVVGLMQGNFRVLHANAGEETVSNGITGAQQYDHGRVKEFRGTTMRLREAESRITESLR